MSDLPSTPEAQNTSDAPPETPAEPVPADDGIGLQHVDELIREAKDAGARVAANDDITSADDAEAGKFSEDPDGSGGHP